MVLKRHEVADCSRYICIFVTVWCRIVNGAPEKVYSSHPVEFRVGMVRDGSRCGTDAMCVDGECISLDLVMPRKCPTGWNGVICSGRGVSPPRLVIARSLWLLFGWWHGSVVRALVSDWRTFPDMRLIYGWRVTTSWVRRPLWVNQPGQLSLLPSVGRGMNSISVARWVKLLAAVSPSSECVYEGKGDVVYLQVTLCNLHLSA